MNRVHLVSLMNYAWSTPINCEWVMRNNFYVTWYFDFITLTHTSRLIFSCWAFVLFWFLSNAKSQFFLSLGSWNFACQLFLGPVKQVWMTWIQSKVYIMFYNNFPFELNFSKWNRISLTLSAVCIFSFISQNSCMFYIFCAVLLF